MQKAFRIFYNHVSEINYAQQEKRPGRVDLLRVCAGGLESDQQSEAFGINDYYKI
jgi:hypothetical protein